MSKQPHKILIVDDEATSLKMLEQVLRKKFTIVTASSGEEALSLLEHNDVSLLISDQRMPGMFGTQLIKTSRSMKPELTCMLMTAHADAATFIDAIRNSGAVRVINKPWEPAELLAAVEAALEQHERLVATNSAMNRLKVAHRNLGKIGDA